MDLTHFALGILVGIVAVIAINGFADLRRRSQRDEAIDAATFLALRQLDEYVKSTKQPSGRPS